MTEEQIHQTFEDLVEIMGYRAPELRDLQLAFEKLVKENKYLKQRDNDYQKATYNLHKSLEKFQD